MAKLSFLALVPLYLSGVSIGHPCGPAESNKQFPYMEITPTDYSKKIVAKVGGPNEVQFEESGGEVEIRCWSKSSFLIEFHGHLTNREAIVDQIEIKEPLQGHRCYSASLRILQLSRSTGEYTCRSLEGNAEANHDSHDHGDESDGGNMTSVYIYIRPNNTKYLLHRHTPQPIKVEQKWDSETVMIPCAVSDPDAEITLKKRPKGSEAAVPWTEVQDKRFDPKQGWILPATKDADEFVYKCSSKSEKDTVEVELFSKRNFTVEPDLQKITYNPDSTVNFSCSAGIPIKIEASDESVVALGDPVEQQKSGGPGGNQTIYQVTRTLSVGYSFENKEVTCFAINGNESEPLHIWRILPPITVWANNKDISLKINHQLESNSRIHQYPCNNFLECGVRQCQIYDSSCPSKPAYLSANSKLPASGGELMELMRPGKPPVVEVYFKSLLNHNYYHTWRTTSFKDVLQVSHKPTEIPLKSSPVGHFVCLASAMVLAAPIRWYLNVPELEDMTPIPPENITTIYGSTKGIIKSEAHIFIPSNADLQNATVRCEAPIWSPEQFSIPMSGVIRMDLVLNTAMMTMRKPKVDEETTTTKRSNQVMKSMPPSGAKAMKSNAHDHHDHDHKNHGHEPRNTAATDSKSTIVTLAAMVLVNKLLF